MAAQGPQEIGRKAALCKEIERATHPARLKAQGSRSCIFQFKFCAQVDAYGACATPVLSEKPPMTPEGFMTKYRLAAYAALACFGFTGASALAQDHAYSEGAVQVVTKIRT